jgi:hypothetical protein
MFKSHSLCVHILNIILFLEDRPVVQPVVRHYTAWAGGMTKDSEPNGNKHSPNLVCY